MPYQSVDQLQKVLADEVFHYAKDTKKAAGRALGTIVEIITFYLLKSWGFENAVAIETALAEYGNSEITHNVEYSLHPVLRECRFSLHNLGLPLTSTRVLSCIDPRRFPLVDFRKSGMTLLTRARVLRNSCIIATGERSHLIASLDTTGNGELTVTVVEQFGKPYAMFECKRVGIEEGMRKGPQTIEKAKQGAYVAKSVSSLYKVRLPSGELRGLTFRGDQSIYAKPYVELIAEIIASDDADLLRDFVLTVGVVSNHGNWFTSENHNKELKVLAQSYDWLLFLTDQGLAQFITALLLDPVPLLRPARDAFLASYTADKTKNQFTKVQMEHQADQVLQTFFRDNKEDIEKWFNVIVPSGKSITELQSQISQLRDKNWRKVHST